MQSSVDILGVEIDKVNMDQSLKIIDDWIDSKSKHYVVTPNIEFIVKAQNNPNFKQVLNQADLSVPDSARFGWAVKTLSLKSKLGKVLMIPFSLAPRLISEFPVTTGTDLMDRLCAQAEKKGYTVALLGGMDGVAQKTCECLKKLYPALKIVYVEAGPKVNLDGEEMVGSKDEFEKSKIKADILFVAFGQVKQEMWIAKNLDKLDVKVAIGVGGAFDYLSGIVPRAPKFVRDLGFEWLFRLILQPWRVKRQLNLLKFIWLVVKH